MNEYTRAGICVLVYFMIIAIMVFVAWCFVSAVTIYQEYKQQKEIIKAQKSKLREIGYRVNVLTAENTELSSQLRQAQPFGFFVRNCETDRAAAVVEELKAEIKRLSLQNETYKKQLERKEAKHGNH